MTQTAFERATVGKRIGDGQCVAYARKYLHDVKGLPWNAVPYGSDANEWWRRAPASRFRKLRGGVPYEGAILLLDHGKHGHVAIVRKGATRDSVPVVEQNWSQRGRVTYGRHRNRNVRWLYPR